MKTWFDHYIFKFVCLLIAVVLINLSCNINTSSQQKKEAKYNSTKVFKQPSQPLPITDFIDTNNIVKSASSTPIVYQPITYDTSKKYIYLTFDDGPQNGTLQCFNVCNKLGVKATFFMIGRNGKSKFGSSLVQAIRNRYPEFLLANHSFSHANENYVYFYEHPNLAVQDFFKAQQSLNVPFKIIRLPGNRAFVRSNEIKCSGLVRGVCTKLDSAAFNVVGWDVEWRFKKGNSYPIETPNSIITQVDTAFHHHTHCANHVIILMHDRMFRKPNYTDSLQKFIANLQQHTNYVFETIDHYPGITL